MGPGAPCISQVQTALLQLSLILLDIGQLRVRTERRVHVCIQVFSAPVHSASVNSVAFAPHELGLMLAAASSDGSISILTYQEGAWSPYKVCCIEGQGDTCASV